MGSFSKEEKSRLADQANKLKSLCHPNITSTFSVWANRSQGEIVIISEKAPGEYMAKVDPGRLKLFWRAWTVELLRTVEYLHENEIAPLDLALENLVYTANGKVAIEDCLFAFDRNEAALALYADETCDSSEELSNMQLLDSLHIGLILLRVFSQEAYPTNIGELLIQLKSGSIPLKLDDIADPKVRKFLSCCICGISHRWTVSQLLNHPNLREEISSEREELTDSLTSRSSDESEDLVSRGKEVRVEITVCVNEVRLSVGFLYDVRKDTPEKVSEELLSELGVSRQFLPQTISVIRRKVTEKTQKADDLITLSPQHLPASSPHPSTLRLQELCASQSFHRPLIESTDTSDLPKLDQSCPSLIDILPKGRAAREEGRGGQEVTAVIYLKKGAESNDENMVKRLQEALNLVLSSDLHVDGVYSKKTEQLVKEFQENQGLEVTGIVESATWYALNLHYQRAKTTAP